MKLPTREFRDASFDLSRDRLANYRDPLSTKEIAPIKLGMSVEDLINQKVEKVPVPKPYPNDEDGDESGTGDKGSGKPGLFDWTEETPFGAAATGTGMVSSLAGLFGNKAHYQQPKYIGEAEKKHLTRARNQLVEGRNQALQDTLAQGRVAREAMQGRHFGSYQANLGNIANITSKGLAKTRGDFAGKLAQADLTSGQRRSAIDQINLQNLRATQQINAQEYDKKLQGDQGNLQNMREMMIEAQYAQNSYEQNKILRNLMSTENFKFDQFSEDDMIKFMSTLYKK